MHRLILCAVLLLSGCSVHAPAGSAPQAPMDASAPVTPLVAGSSALLPLQPIPSFASSEWRTDFTRSLVPWSEITSGGPPKDGIPAIDQPRYEDIDAAARWLKPHDPLLVVESNGSARAYPLAILIWHEIVNDTIDGEPIAVTFCPLCNASIVFRRMLGGRTLDFGTTGSLRNSDLLMYDRQTESWWQQATGQAVIGALAGAQLEFVPAYTLSFADYAALFPQGDVLAQPEFDRAYGRNPYVGYDSTDRPFLFRGDIDARLPSVERVVGYLVGDHAVAYPFGRLSKVGAINDIVAGLPIVVLHKQGMASALDAQLVAEGRSVGSIGVFERRVEGRELTFEVVGPGAFRDRESGSLWSIVGRAIEGPLAGTQLERLVAYDHFWFAWAAFYPTTEVRAE